MSIRWRRPSRPGHRDGRSDSPRLLCAGHVQRGRNREPERIRGLAIYDEFELGRRLEQDRTRHGRFRKDAGPVRRLDMHRTFKTKVPPCPGSQTATPRPHLLSTP